MKKRLYSFLLLWIALTTLAISEENDSMKIKITAGKTVLTATMMDNATSRDFMSMLPLTLTLKDYAGTEKITDLPRKLSTQGAPSGSDPSVGDITLYAPWGNLAIFYKDFGYASGLIILGKIDSGVDKLCQLNGEVTFRQIE
ncbi:MAG: cyclophilin-like fold protein [Desulfuromonadales bacterium]